jgi:hypothetical protein
MASKYWNICSRRKTYMHRWLSWSPPMI